MTISPLALIIIAVLSIVVVGLVITLFKEKEARRGEREEFTRAIGEARERSVSTHRAVTLGQVSEQLAPFLPGFDYNPKDARFLREARSRDRPADPRLPGLAPPVVGV